MNTKNLAISFLNDAKIILEEALSSFDKGHYHRVVRKCQESSELAIKGIFHFYSIDYPKTHLLGKTIKRELRKFDIFSSDELEKMVYYSNYLTFEREESFYGTRDGVGASQLYDIDDAKVAIEYASFIVEKAKLVIKR